MNPALEPQLLLAIRQEIDGLAGANGAPFLNPFGAQTSAGVDYINASKIVGQMQDISGKLYGVNGQVSGDSLKLPAGPLSAAFLASWQKEEIDYKNNFALIRQAASSGLELAEELRRVRPDLQVIVATGGNARDLATRARDVHVLEKPFSPDALLSEVEAALRRRGR